jgi:hypothetical protein
LGANQQAAYALDAADGVIDGKHFGSQVAVAAPVPAVAPQQVPQYNLDDPIDHRNYDGKVISVDYIVHEPSWQPTVRD